MSEQPQTEATRLIRASSDLLAMFGTRTEDGRRLTAEWGQPVGHDAETDEYIYEPVFTATDDGWRAAIEREAVAAWKASPEAAEELARALRRYAPPQFTHHRKSWFRPDDRDAESILAALRDLRAATPDTGSDR